MLAAFLSAIKYNEDKTYSNKHYSIAGGVYPKELSILEFEFLKLIEYDLFVHSKDYNNCLSYAQDKVK